VTAAHRVTLFGLAGLIVLNSAWHLWLAPSPRFPVWLMLGFFVLPLLLPLKGVLTGRLYTHRWLPLLALFYFMHGVVESIANPGERHLAAAEVLLSVTLFAGGVAVVRNTLRARQQPTRRHPKAL